MWFIQYLPDAMVAIVVWTICLGGAATWIVSKAVKWLPGVAAYKTPLEIIGIVALLFGVYLQGGRANEAVWQQRVQDLEAQVAAAQAKSAEKNVEIQTKVVEKTRVVREKGQEIIKYVDREVVKNNEVVKYVERCPVPQPIIDAHNAAAAMNRAAAGEQK